MKRALPDACFEVPMIDRRQFLAVLAAACLRDYFPWRIDALTDGFITRLEGCAD